MDCRTCGYPLFNLGAGACPECGTPYRPSDFEFAPGSVRFCCPHCDQAYYGTGPRGELVPAAFTCVRCGRPVEFDQTIVRPREDFAARALAGASMPWFERDRRGTVPAFVATAKASMTAPASVIEAVPESSSLWSATGFMLGTVLTCAVVGALPAMLFTLVLLGVVAPGGAPRGVFVWQALGLGAQVLALIPAALLWIVLAHGTLRLIHRGARPLARTWQCIAYSSASTVVMVVPCCGWQAGGIWWLVSAIGMVAAGHRCSAGRATAAVLPAWLLCAAFAWAGGFFASVGAGPFMAGRMRTTVPMTMTATTAATGWRDRNGAWPAHGLDLLGSPLVPTDFASSDDPLFAAPVAGGPTLEVLEAQPLLWSGAASDAAAALPRPGAPHRVGRIVFVWEGVPVDAGAAEARDGIDSPDDGVPAAPDDGAAPSDGAVPSDGTAARGDPDPLSDPAELWILVRLAAAPGESIVIGTARGAEFGVSPEDFPAYLDAENRRRERLGVPTLDPALFEPPE